MAKEIRCADLMPGCKFVATAATEDEVMRKAAQHAAKTHNIKEMPLDLVKKVKAAIRTA
jgi:predicted small metal-binding protein